MSFKVIIPDYPLVRMINYCCVLSEVIFVNAAIIGSSCLLLSRLMNLTNLLNDTVTVLVADVAMPATIAGQLSQAASGEYEDPPNPEMGWLSHQIEPNNERIMPHINIMIIHHVIP